MTLCEYAGLTPHQMSMRHKNKHCYCKIKDHIPDRLYWIRAISECEKYVGCIEYQRKKLEERT